MQSIDYTKLSGSSKLLLQRADALARDSHFDEISTTLLLIAMVQQAKEMVRFILDRLNIDYQQFCIHLNEYLQNAHRFNNRDPQFFRSV